MFTKINQKQHNSIKLQQQSIIKFDLNRHTQEINDNYNQCQMTKLIQMTFYIKI